jgi:phenylalanyl-tRNA synthetase beta chain
LDKTGVDNSSVEIIHEAPFDYGLQLILGTKTLGRVGLVNQRIAKLTEVKQEVFYAELDWDLLTKKAKGLKKYSEISKFPEVRRDLSLVIDKSVTFDQIKSTALKSGGKLLQRVGVFDVYQGDKIDASKKAYALSFYLQDPTQTLTDKVIDKAMTRLIQSFENEVSKLLESFGFGSHQQYCRYH